MIKILTLKSNNIELFLWSINKKIEQNSISSLLVQSTSKDEIEFCHNGNNIYLNLYLYI